MKTKSNSTNKLFLRHTTTFSSADPNRFNPSLGISESRFTQKISSRERESISSFEEVHRGTCMYGERSLATTTSESRYNALAIHSTTHSFYLIAKSTYAHTTTTVPLEDFSLLNSEHREQIKRTIRTHTHTKVQNIAWQFLPFLLHQQQPLYSKFFFFADLQTLCVCVCNIKSFIHTLMCYLYVL